MKVKEVLQEVSNLIDGAWDSIVISDVLFDKIREALDKPEEKLYTEKEVYELCLKAMNDAHSLNCLPKITNCKEWFNSKKK